MAQYVPLTDQESAANEPLPRGILWAMDPEKRPLSGSSFKDRFIAALPRFAQPGGIHHRKIGPTSYLDALRGYAAWAVFIAHFFKHHESEQTWQAQPVINLMFAGAAMVSLFFVISGYALSYRLLILMRRQDSEALLQAIASCTWRRFIRLYGSSVAACAIAFVFVRLRLYDGMHPPIYQEHLSAQIIDFIGNTLRFCNPFSDLRTWWHPGVLDSKYLSQLWTIPVEYRGSMVLFSFCVGACKLSTRGRLIAAAGFAIASFAWEAVFVAEFMAGLFIADLGLCMNPSRLGNAAPLHLEHREAAPATASGPSSRKSKLALICLFVVSLFLLGQPETTTLLGVMGQFPWHAMKTFIWKIFPWWTNDQSFWFCIGSVCLVSALEFFPALQKPLQWRFSQYVGDLSFGIYTLHVPVATAVLHGWLHPLRIQYLGESWLAWLPAIIGTHIFVFAAADYFSRIDKAVVKFARWTENMVFVKWQS